MDAQAFHAGLRYDYLNNKVEEQDAQGGRWIGPRHFDAIENVPNWKDLSPRLGVSYDLTGNGKTALKFTVSRYVATTTVGYARGINPLNTSVNSATRTWNDSNGDQIPQDSELGPLGSTFGQLIISTTYDPDVVKGWFERRHNWEYSASVTRELMPRVSAELAYFRRTQGHYTTTDNRDVSPTDYQEFCITAPSDPRLPGGGGNQICGLYDLDPLKFGPQFADDNVVSFVDDFGKQTQTFDGFDFILTARPRTNLFINGGFSTGIENTDECDSFVDNPSASTSGGATLTPRAWCKRDNGWQSNYKLSGSYTLPWHDIQLGAVFQNLQGQQILANWNVTSTTPGVTLGRAFAGGGSRTIPLIRPGDMYADRRSQLDLRVGKGFRLGGPRRLQLMVDVYNTFNSNAAVGATSQAGETPPSLNTTYSSTDPTRPGGAWLTPLNILQGRYVKFGTQLVF